jgi:hypothetical protein
VLLSCLTMVKLLLVRVAREWLSRTSICLSLLQEDASLFGGSVTPVVAWLRPIEDAADQLNVMARTCPASGFHRCAVQASDIMLQSEGDGLGNGIGGPSAYDPSRQPSRSHALCSEHCIAGTLSLGLHSTAVCSLTSLHECRWRRTSEEAKAVASGSWALRASRCSGPYPIES